jgi:hypothetical protein
MPSELFAILITGLTATAFVLIVLHQLDRPRLPSPPRSMGGRSSALSAVGLCAFATRQRHQGLAGGAIRIESTIASSSAINSRGASGM